MKKVKVAVPYVQWDVYEVEIPDDADEQEALTALEYGPDECYKQLGAKDIMRVDDYLQGYFNSCPFLVSDENLDEYAWSIGG